MSKVSLSVVLCLVLTPSVVFSVALRDSYVRAHDNTRRVSTIRKLTDFFFDGLYNRQGKAHDLGSDFGLTSDVYTKLNPFYTKNLTKDKTAEKKPEPVYYPVYNRPVNPDTTAPEDSYEPSPQTYDSKPNTYVGTSYSVPSNAHGTPTFSVHSSPGSSYSVPSTHYGSGYSSYYPPSTYGSPQPTAYYSGSTSVQQPAQKSHGGWLLAKIMKKFDLILVSKILLKLIIFKKIVKFIGIICLLLFIPVLKKKFDEHTDGVDDEEERRIKGLDAYANVDFRLKEIVNFAFTAIEGFSTDNIPWCVGESPFYCRLQYALDSIDLRYPGSTILERWFPKLQTTTTSQPPLAVEFNDSITESQDAALNENGDDDSDANRIEHFKALFKR